jgi:hypothetical protein
MAVSLFAVHAMAQKTTTDTTTKKKNTWAHAILGDHSDDHFMFQLGYDDFLNKHDSISLKGIGRSFNAYFMKAFPFKTDKRFAFALGLGFGTDNYYLNKEVVANNLNNGTRVTFISDTIDAFKKTKLAVGFLEAPAEIRYNAHPDNMNNTWKFALGVKLGVLLSAHTKEKFSRDQNNLVDYTLKYRDTKLFNPVRAASYFRIGYGVWSLFMQVTMTSFIKVGDGPPLIPYTAGIGISGL